MYLQSRIICIAFCMALACAPQRQSNIDLPLQAETDTQTFCTETSCSGCEVTHEFSPGVTADDDDPGNEGDPGDGGGVDGGIPASKANHWNVVTTAGGVVTMEVLVELAQGTQGQALTVTVREVTATGQVLRTVSRLRYEASVNPTAAEIARAEQGGRAAASAYAASRGGVCRTLVRFGGAFTVAIVVQLVYASYLSAGEAAAMNLISQLETFYGDCDSVYRWVMHSYSQPPTDSCQSCYDYVFSGSTRAPGTGSITVCSAHMPGGTYQQLVTLVGNRVGNRANYCAAFPRGYYSQPFTRPLFLPDPPNVPDRSAVCPY